MPGQRIRRQQGLLERTVLHNFIAEALKNKKYKDSAEKAHATFVACAFESTGAIGEPVRKIYNIIVSLVLENQSLYTAKEIREQLSFRVAIAIQRRNARATLDCLGYAADLARSIRRDKKQAEQDKRDEEARRAANFGDSE